MTQTEVLLAGRYRMGQLLGSGGFGSVYLATDERLHRLVAIKVCSTRGLPQHEATEAAQLFQSEALTLARLRHPGLTAIWDYFNEDDNWYLVMEYVPGDTLRTLLKRSGGPLPHAEAISYTRQLCAVLSYLHRQHPPVVFRDLKPANIMITPEGQLKLIDFGIARLFSPGKTADTSQFGTPGYAPPEQYGGQTEPRSDVYSMGVVLHQMLSGHNPTSSPFALPPLRTLNPAIDERLEALVVKATAYHINERIESADAFCAWLDDATTRRPTTYTMPAPRIAQPVSQTQMSPTGRPMWSPAPRALPTRPASSGVGRGFALIALLVLLLGSLGTGIYLLRSQIIGLTNDLTSIVAPTTSIIGTQPTVTVFSAPTTNGGENLYQLNLTSGTLRSLAEFPSNAGASQPAISRDGTKIAFNKETREFDGTTWNVVGSEVWVMNADGAEQRPVLPGAQSRSPAWSPDGQWLALEVAKNRLWGDHDIAVVNVTTGQLRRLVSSTMWEGGPTWSPDGTQIAYQGRRPGYQCMQLFTIDAQGGEPTQLTDLKGAGCGDGRSSRGAYWPDWSPDGTQIAFGQKLGDREQIALLDVATKTVQLLDTGAQPAGYPRWSADNTALLFEQGKRDAVRLVRLDLRSCDTGCKAQTIDTTITGSHLADWR